MAAHQRAVVHVLRLAAGKLSIYDQLCIEEAILRADTRNWCVPFLRLAKCTAALSLSSAIV
jgi:hypothetical protein